MSHKFFQQPARQIAGQARIRAAGCLFDLSHPVKASPVDDLAGLRCRCVSSGPSKPITQFADVDTYW
jgi:hypothetical protein